LTEEPRFLHVCVLDGNGGSKDVASPATVSPNDGVLWVHIDLGDPGSRQWLSERCGLSEAIAEALLAKESRPRSIVSDDGVLVALRGVNLNPGEDPEDMVSVRVWIERNRIITTRRRRVMSVQGVYESLQKDQGPRTQGEFLGMLVERLADLIGVFVDQQEEVLEDAESRLADIKDFSAFRQNLADLRRRIASVRRFLMPQRDALDRLCRHTGSLISDVETTALREEADRITRYLEDLDLARERAVVLQEEFLSQIAQEQNSRIYVLSIVAAVFLPLGFLTGLLGMNVGGLPGTDSPIGFLVAVVCMALATAGLIVLFRWKRWI
jgi:zinc transporter